MSTVVRAPRIATSLCPNPPLSSCAVTGSPTAIPVFSSPPSAEAASGQRKLKLPWLKVVSKAPSVTPSLMPASLKRELPYTRCAIPTPPTSSKPASSARHPTLHGPCPTRNHYALSPPRQQTKSQPSIKKPIYRQLPPPHFLFTFTVPQNSPPFMRKNQRAAYSSLCKTSSKAIKKRAPDQHHLGGDLPGFFGALHTWG